ncbi:hypothetical protein D3C72_792690 [compost metagenome]
MQRGQWCIDRCLGDDDRAQLGVVEHGLRGRFGIAKHFRCAQYRLLEQADGAARLHLLDQEIVAGFAVDEPRQRVADQATQVQVARGIGRVRIDEYVVDLLMGVEQGPKVGGGQYNLVCVVLQPLRVLLDELHAFSVARVGDTFAVRGQASAIGTLASGQYGRPRGARRHGASDGIVTRHLIARRLARQIAQLVNHFRHPQLARRVRAVRLQVRQPAADQHVQFAQQPRQIAHDHGLRLDVGAGPRGGGHGVQDGWDAVRMGLAFAPVIVAQRAWGQFAHMRKQCRREGVLLFAADGFDRGGQQGFPT